MKRIISLLTILCMLCPLCFTVEAAGTLYQLNLTDVTLGTYTENNLYITDKATLKVEEDEETGEKYIRAHDNDPSTSSGFCVSKLPINNKATISLKFRRVQQNVNFYISGTGHCASVVLSSPLSYYETPSSSVKTEKSLNVGEWTDITVIVDKTSKTFDLYKNGIIAADDAPFRAETSMDSTFTVYLMSSAAGYETIFDFKDVTVYDGEVIPEVTEPEIPKAERTLVDFQGSVQRLNSVLSNSVAMSIGNSMARVNNSYVHIDPDSKYVAPFITEDGYTLIPTRFTTETIGCEVEVLSPTSFRFSKDGTVMEINMGDKNAIINGVPKEMPTTPVIKYDRLFIPLRFAAETYGKNVFWDDRGLIIISDGEVVKAGQEEIIKPLLSQIRQYTTLYGNRKYSDVNYSSRYYHLDGHTTGTELPQWGTLDAAKRFMATVNRWTYAIDGKDAQAMLDQGLIVQGTLNANFTDYSKKIASVFFDGTPYTRADGVWDSYWGCLSDPEYQEHLWKRAKSGLDTGLFSWQYDDYPVNAAYRDGGCFCDHCMKAFKEYLSTVATAEELAAAEITDPANFNYKVRLQEMGITKHEQYSQANITPVGKLWTNFNIYRVSNYHTDLKKRMEEYIGQKIYYSFNASNTVNSITNNWIYNLVEAVMGETSGANTSAESIYATMLFTRALGVENVISPLPKDENSKRLMMGGIPMCYATGQYMLVPWDDWLFGSTRYYTTLEEMEHLYELPREYPYLFDNYEIPELIGYVYNIDEMSEILSTSKSLLSDSMPARIIAHHTDSSIPITANKLKGVVALVEGTDLSKLPAKELALIENSGIVTIKPDDTASIDYLKNAYWMTRDNNEDVYTILRQNQLYDNAPTVVHAVNYNASAVQNAEIEINNLYLPQGDSLTVNVYTPGKDFDTITVKKGDSSTKIKLDELSRWAVLEISGDSTVRREASFYLGDGYNGIGMGTRISKDKLYGTLDDFTIVTYGEGINSTTLHDDEGSQDEAAFVYKHFGTGTYKEAQVKAGFGEADGAYGVMVRDGVYSNARFISLMYDKTNGLRLAYRNDTNKGVEYTEISKDKPNYMQLMRVGGKWIAYTSDNGTDYTQVAEFEQTFVEPVGGVFASSPDGKRALCNVKDFFASAGGYPKGNFEQLIIRYPGGKISRIADGEKLIIDLSTSAASGLTPADIPMTFTSSDENVAKVLSDGTIVPVNVGTVTITGTAAMGLKKISATTKLTVENPVSVMYEESFNSSKFPEYMQKITAGNIEVTDGALSFTAKNVGEEADVKFTFDQYNFATVFEFDFRAKFGTTSPTTGARVIYGNGTGLSLTADPNGFNWFFGDNQTHIMPIEENKWYHIKIEADYKAQTANVYIDGKQVVENGDCRTAIAADGNIRIGGWRLGTDSCYEWDNFKVSVK